MVSALVMKVKIMLSIESCFTVSKIFAQIIYFKIIIKLREESRLAWRYRIPPALT